MTVQQMDMAAEAYAVEHEEPIRGYWEGFTTRSLTRGAAKECARIKIRFGARNVRIVRDLANDGRATLGQWA